MLGSALGAAAAGLLAQAPGAMAFFSPESGAGSPNAESILTLYNITLYLAVVIFVLVEGGLIYALWRFRARRGHTAKQIHGHTGLEFGWTAGAAVIVVALAVLTFVKLSSILNPPNSGPNGAKVSEIGEMGTVLASASRRLPPNKKSLNITVIGRQYLWQYIYPGATEPDGLGAPYSYETMVVPTNTTVTLDVVTADVIHSWWIPDLGGKVQAVPGLHNYTWFKITKPGTYRGQCANMCGRGHARMIASVKAVPPAQFEEWLSKQKEELAEANEKAGEERQKLTSQTGPAQVNNP